jgi:hypothetical protein
MKPVWRNFWTDLVLFFQMLALLVTGLILKYGLPPGRGRGQGWGRHQGGPRELFGLKRHDWGDIHFWIAVSLVAILLLHLVLHWGWIRHRLGCLVARHQRSGDSTGRLVDRLRESRSQKCDTTHA